MGIRLAPSLRWAVLAGCGVLLLAGCGQFFPPLTKGGGGTSSGDYLYAGNLASSNLGIGGFTFASSSLTSLSGSPFSAVVAPIGLAVTPKNSYLYVAGGANGIGVYPINSDGTLGTGSIEGGFEVPRAVQVDTSGGWLIAMDDVVGQVYAFQINSSTGALSQPLSSSVATLPNCTPSSDLAGLNPGLVIAPNDNYVYASCGTAGIYVLSFDSTSGALTEIGAVNAKNGGADSGLAIAALSGTDYLLATETVTNGVRVFSIVSNGQFTEITGSPFSTGAGPDAVLVNSTNAYVYVANRTDGTISGFTLGTGGALTQISGSPWSTGSLPVALVEDNSHTYIAAICNGGNADLETYTIGTAGALTSFKNSATGSDPTQASSVAATH
ncbi:MAG: beta-propeller fold lactonase family protein [Acidobacteriaceae bacterium]